MPDREKINAQGIEVTFYTRESHADYVSLTDIARYKSAVPKDVIKNWLRTHDVIEFLGLWEKLHNPRFKGVEFDSFRDRSGSNSFTLSPSQWIERTDAVGIVSRPGRGGEPRSQRGRRSSAHRPVEPGKLQRQDGQERARPGVSAGSAQPSSSRAALAVAPLRCGRGAGKRQDEFGARTTSCFVTIY